MDVYLYQSNHLTFFIKGQRNLSDFIPVNSIIFLLLCLVVVELKIGVNATCFVFLELHVRHEVVGNESNFLGLNWLRNSLGLSVFFG